MSIEQTLDTQLKDAMRSKDKPRIACIRQVRSKVQEASNAPNFAGGITDALVTQVIASYVKQLEKSCSELAAGGERGATLVAQYRSEVDYLSQFLPKQLDDAAIRALIATELQTSGVTDVRQAGRVVGALMKAHKGQLDAQRAKTLVEEAMASRPGEGT